MSGRPTRDVAGTAAHDAVPATRHPGRSSRLTMACPFLEQLLQAPTAARRARNRGLRNTFARSTRPHAQDHSTSQTGRYLGGTQERFTPCSVNGRTPDAVRSQGTDRCRGRADDAPGRAPRGIASRSSATPCEVGVDRELSDLVGGSLDALRIQPPAWAMSMFGSPASWLPAHHSEFGLLYSWRVLRTAKYVADVAIPSFPMTRRRGSPSPSRRSSGIPRASPSIPTTTRAGPRIHARPGCSSTGS